MLPMRFSVSDMTPPVPVALGAPPYVARPIPAVLMTWVTPRMIFSVQRFGYGSTIFLISVSNYTSRQQAKANTYASYTMPMSVN